MQWKTIAAYEQTDDATEESYGSGGQPRVKNMAKVVVCALSRAPLAFGPVGHHTIKHASGAGPGRSHQK
jgi:hypothetical protein